MERVKRQPVRGIYCRDKKEAEITLANYKKLESSEEKGTNQMFDVTWGRIWKFWVGTKESFQHELDIYNARTLRRKSKKKS